MADAAIVGRFLAASTAAKFGAMREALAPDLVACVTTSEGATDRVGAATPTSEAMDLPAARFQVELTAALGRDRSDLA